MGIITRKWTPADMARPPKLWHRMDSGDIGTAVSAYSEDGRLCTVVSSPETEHAPDRTDVPGAAKPCFVGGHYGWPGTGDLLEGATGLTVVLAGIISPEPADGTRNVYLSLAGSSGEEVCISQGVRKFPEPGGGGIAWPDRRISVLKGRLYSLRKDV